MDLKITGQVVQILDEQSGEGRNGPWRKQEFILETEGQYPNSICVVQWGDDIDKFGVQEGERLTAHIDIRSREYQGRWYTDVKAWRVEREQAAGEGPGAPGAPGTQGVGPGAPGASGELPPLEDDDLPF